MSEHMKMQTMGELTEISLVVPNEVAEKMRQVLTGIVEMLVPRKVNENGEELYSIDEVFPDANPGMALRGLRTREGLTQKEFAERLQIKQTRVSEMERGVRPISRDMAKRLAKEFKVSYKVFL